jgi:D-sedoheptulose 7-phosphate isomerase
MNHIFPMREHLIRHPDEYVFCGEHRALSEYAENLSAALSQIDLSSIVKLGHLIRSVHKAKGRIYLCGNGGSAANAVHIANDFVYSIAEKTGLGIDTIALCANPAVMTCLANDVGYTRIYSEQLAVSGRKGDLLIALSGSGNSENVVDAIRTANDLGMYTAALLGFDGGKCLQLVGLPIHFKIQDMQIAEDLQLTVGHMLMRWLKKEIMSA